MAFAATVNETAMLYVADGEVSATSIVPFKSGAASYYMVAVATKEVLLLEPTDSDFQPVSDNATLISVLPAYISSAYANVFSDANVESLKTHFDVLNKTFNYCDEVMSPFLKNSFIIYYIQQIDDRGTPIPKTKLAIDYLLGNATLGNGSSYKLKTGFALANEKILVVSPQASPDVVRESLFDIYDTFSELKTIAGQYATDFNLLESRHPDMFSKRVCALSEASFANVTDDLRIRESIPSAASLSSAIIASTQPRVEFRKIKEIILNKTKKLGEITALHKSVQKTLAGTGIELSGINKSVQNLDSNLTLLKTATTLASARTIEAMFDKAYNSTYAWLYALNSTTLATDIAASVNASKTAKNSTDGAALRLGENNEDVVKVKQKFKSFQANLNSNLSAVQNASEKIVPAATFQNLTITATGIAKEADNLRPAWDQNILMIIAGGIILVALMMGIVIWYRNQKALSEVSEKITAKGSKEIDIRNLKDE